jgi:hypothetical protein
MYITISNCTCKQILYKLDFLIIPYQLSLKEAVGKQVCFSVLGRLKSCKKEGNNPIQSPKDKNRQTDRQTGRHADRQTDRQIGRQTDGRTDKQTDRQTRIDSQKASQLDS